MSRCIHGPSRAFARGKHGGLLLSSRNNARRLSGPDGNAGPTPINESGIDRVNRPHSSSSIAVVAWTSSAALCFQPLASSASSPPHPLLLLPAVRAFTQHAPRPSCWSCSGISRPPSRRPRVCSGHLLCSPRLFSSSPCTMSATKIGGTAIAKKIRERLRSEIEEKQAKNPLYKPCLKIIQGCLFSLVLMSLPCSARLTFIRPSW